MIEIVAAVLGVALGVGASGLGALFKRDNDAAVAVVRLTTSVEHIAGEVSMLRGELKGQRDELKVHSAELWPKVNDLERRLSLLEHRG